MDAWVLLRVNLGRRMGFVTLGCRIWMVGTRQLIVELGIARTYGSGCSKPNALWIRNEWFVSRYVVSSLLSDALRLASWRGGVVTFVFGLSVARYVVIDLLRFQLWK